MAGRDRYVSELILSKTTGKPGFAISRGIRSEQGELLGVVAAFFDPDSLDHILRIDRSKDAGVSLIDNKGMHVNRYPETAISWEERNWLKLYSVIEIALKGNEVTSTITVRSTGQKRLAGFVPIPSIGWVAAASRAEKDAMAAIISALLRQTILFMIVTLAAFFGALLVSRSISTPIKRLRNQALQLGYGEKDIPAGKSGPSELRDLAEVFHKMAENVRSRESELVESEEKFRTLFRSVPEPLVLALCDEATILEVNEAFCSFLGFSNDEIIGKSLMDLGIWHDLSERTQMSCVLTSQKGVSDFECRLRTKSGEIKTVILSVETVEIGSRHEMLFIIVDITARKQSEAERIKLEREIQQARKAESLGRMAGAIAHQFNNKLMAVSGYLELALNGANSNQVTLTHLLEAQRATSQAAEISRLMLAYLGQALPLAAPFDLAEVCREVIETHSSSLPMRVTLKGDIPPRGPTIMANRTQAVQILTSLITNGWEAIGEGQGDIQVSLRMIDAAGASSLHIFPTDWKPDRDTYACLEVSDTGSGINPEQLDMIFDPFFSTKFTGRGLGLAVVLGAVRSYGGAIAVESEPGRGSIFRVFWPIAEKVEQPLQQVETVAFRPIPGSGLVLFVDDEYHIRNIAEEMLGLLGFKAITAGHGFEALDIFRMRKDEISLVILDITMPGMNGWEVMDALRALRPDIPVVLASGYDEAQVMEGKHTEHPQAFLHKPYRMMELKAAIVAATGAAF